MKTIRNEMIMASAGSGKTYALTTRFIALLAAGVAPERIAALTFTRKAAGEFFDEILNRLAIAASSGEAAVKLAREIGSPGRSCASFERLLRGMIDAMPKLTLGTMDSFFARIVTAFPFELGLAGEIRILDDAEAAEETRRVLGRFLGSARGHDGERQALMEAFRFATMGIEAKSVTGTLDRFIEEYHELFRTAGDISAWGNPGRIWPGGFPWGEGVESPDDKLRTVREWTESGYGMTEGQRNRWSDFVHAFLEWSPGMVWPRPLGYLIGAVLQAGPEFSKGGAEAVIDRRKQTPPAGVCAAVWDLVRGVVGMELGRRLVVTRGIGALLARFDAVYDSEVRRSGKLTFSDVLDLLGAGGIVSSGDHDEDFRRTIDFRLDSRIDHWLLDEFQDTSRRQWIVLEGLVDEAVQDPSGERSLFYVGDVKQAIFSWRGGDPKLFEHVARRYSKGGPGAVRRSELNLSFRSGEAIVGLVNRVFGSAAIANVLPEASQEWQQVWRPHESAVPEREGQAAILLASGTDGRFGTVLDLIREIDPMARGFSCAVLVQKNQTASEVAEFLRRTGGVPAVAESDLHIAKDNPWCAAFLSLVKCAAHPGDSIAWRHLIMTPARTWLESAGIGSREELSACILGKLGRDGHEALAAEWLSGMRKALPAMDAFTRLRSSQLIAAAREFDESGGGTAAAFLRWMERATVRETEGAEVVRVMTIHKSKGLGFDVVILPDLEGGGLASRRSGPAIATRDNGGIDWILEFPGMLIAENDKRLGENLAVERGNAAFDSLARLYVAMTRAKRGLFAIIEPAKPGTSCSYPRLLTESVGSGECDVAVGSRRFAGICSSGDSRWISSGAKAAAPKDWKPGIVPEECAVERIQRSNPSESVEVVSGVPDMLADARSAGSRHGTAVHELLKRVEWTDGLDVESWAAEAIARGAEGEAVREAAGTLARPEFQSVFRKPGPGWEVWRERAIEVIVEGVWLSAVIDRACVFRPADGRIRECRLYDFKTGRDPSDLQGTNPAKGHAAQMGGYKRALAEAAGLRAESIFAAILYTKSGELTVV